MLEYRSTPQPIAGVVPQTSRPIRKQSRGPVGGPVRGNSGRTTANSPPCRRGRARKSRRHAGTGALLALQTQPPPLPMRREKARARKRARRASGALRRESGERPRAAGRRIRVRCFSSPGDGTGRRSGRSRSETWTKLCPILTRPSESKPLARRDPGEYAARASRVGRARLITGRGALAGRSRTCWQPH